MNSKNPKASNEEISEAYGEAGGSPNKEEAMLLFTAKTQAALVGLDTEAREEIIELVATLGDAVGKLAKPPALRVDIELVDDRWTAVVKMYGHDLDKPVSGANLHDVMVHVVVNMAMNASRPDRGNPGDIFDQVEVIHHWASAARRIEDFLLKTNRSAWDSFMQRYRKLNPPNPESKVASDSDSPG